VTLRTTAHRHPGGESHVLASFTHRIESALLWAGSLALLAVLIWQGVTAAGAPDPLSTTTGWGAATLDIGILVFREGLECVLVLAAITASMVGASRTYRKPIALGVILAALATLLTWRIALSIIDNLAESFPALQVQAATGLLAIVVLLVVMNWFFHKVYWTGWIAAHTKRKRELLRSAERSNGAAACGGEQTSETAYRVTRSARRVFWGLAALGFTSFYREGFEVVLFLQNYRLRLGSHAVLSGVSIGLGLSIVVAALTLVAHRRLPHKRLLVLTGALLGGVLLIMVGEQAQEMQLAGWLPTTMIPWLESVIPDWMGLWLAVFPTVETLVAQSLAALLVLGSYVFVQGRIRRLNREASPA
jgi:high-affinity iron transporter